MFSIIIPTYNNFDYFKLCLKSIKKNSFFNSHEIVAHVNEGVDGTYDFIKKNNIKHSYSKANEGVCVAFNEAVKISTNKYIILAHDDMYFCPNWDKVFYDEIQNSKVTDFFMSGTMVQHFNGLINYDCGKDFNDFNEIKLLKNINNIPFDDFQGTHWQPSLIPRKTWDKVGGFSLEFSPGLGSDPDFNMKLWKIGVRQFKGLSGCRVYHFSSVSLRKKAWNDGAKIFLLKWKISIKFFKKHYLRSGKLYDGLLKAPEKKISYYFDFALTKIKYFYAFLLNLFKIYE
jgi:glycosyltransferase involved in cell wall biosynthesis